MCREEESKHGKDECECDYPEIRDASKDGRCSRQQILKCHGAEKLHKWESEGKVTE
ncbi:MAG: hypothetical protein RBG13Loki_2928 [Promethearchaeota archaeon CR_4]|nr:MAG: hypothetical protein RBG13Loki_2928 [Candidatus Lokiarchaeota archaeon CR_4]